MLPTPIRPPAQTSTNSRIVAAFAPRIRQPLFLPACISRDAGSFERAEQRSGTLLSCLMGSLGRRKKENMGSATNSETLTTLLFDIDGTLLISQRAGGRAIDTVFEQVFGRPHSIELRLHGRTDRGILTELFNAEGRELTDAEFAAFIDSYLRELDQNLHQQPATVLPGVTQLLPWLAEHPQVALGLLTGNVRQGAQTKLRHTGLEHFFAFGGFGDAHAHRDDVAREAAHAAQSHLQHRFCPQSVVVIGDTVHDITCGKAIGAKTLAVLTGGAQREELAAAQPDWICTDLRQGFSILQHLLG